MSNKYEIFSRLRKQLQSDGLAPDWYSTASYQLLANKHYLDVGETPKDMYTRIAKRAAELTSAPVPIDLGYSTWFDAYFDIMWKGWLSPSTPVLTNMGNNRGHPIACSGTHVGDSIRSFYQALTELAQLTQRGYGTSVSLDSIRRRGAPISTGGEANGPWDFADDVVNVMKKVSQGSSRRGSAGQYINILNPDVDEFLDQLNADDDGWNIGWNITDDYEALFKRDPEEADRLWKRMLKTKMTKGKGYMLFLDKVNRNRPQMYVDKGFYVKQSNLCLSGDTKILTSNGYKSLVDLAGSSHTIWNGQEWSNDVEVVQTSAGQSVLDVTFDNFTTIQATPYHKWYVQTGYGNSNIVTKSTAELQPGDKIAKHSLSPVTHGTLQLNKAYENGFYSGDGTSLANRQRIYLYDNKRTLLPRFTTPVNLRDTGTRYELEYTDLAPKFFIPDTTYDVKSRLDWLAGYIDADGTLTNNAGTESIQVGSTNLPFLKEVSLLLQELGVHSTISLLAEAGYRLMPKNDGTDESANYWCEATHRLLIAGSQLSQLLQLGFAPSRVVPTSRHYQRDARQFVKVVSVVDNNTIIPTYCMTEPKRHAFVANGILTGNCSEILLFNDEEHSFTCVLSSMNIAKYDEWKDTKAIFISTVFLDAVIEDMLIKARQEPGFERVIAFTEKSRAIGLGVLGLSSYYQQQSWVFGDFQSIQFNRSFFKMMSDETLKASKFLAAEVGEPEWMKDYGERFSHRIALPPTKSTSIIQGGISEGIMPVFANVFEQDTAGGTVYRINPVLLPIMKARGHYNNETMKRIAEAQGSVQGESWLSDHEKKVFKTAFEINQESILLMASHRQQVMGPGAQGQSVNLYFQAEEPEEEISRIHDIAFKDPWIFGLYYIHSLNEESTYKVDKSECEGCQG